MDKVTLLVAQGPNDVEVPCRIMKSVKAAHDFCKELNLELSEKNDMRFFLPDLDKDTELSKKLFTSYYGGCGEAYALVIREVEFDTVFVGFDLD